MKRQNVYNSTLIILLILLIGFGCTNLMKGKDVGEKAVVKFHQQLAEAKYGEIYANADDIYKKAATEEQSNQIFEAVSKKLGKVKSANLESWKSNSTTDGSFTVLTYQTEFEKDKGTEIFTFRITDDDAKIVGYNVNSPAFIK